MESDNSSANNSPKTQSVQPPLLPRSAWHSQLTRLRLTLHAKQLLDQQERSLDIATSSDIP